jgi:polyhydroxyalkanoate synthase
MSDRDGSGTAQQSAAHDRRSTDRLLEQMQEAQARFFRDFMDNATPAQNADMVNMYQSLMRQLMQDPQQLLQQQARYTQEQFQLWLNWVSQQAGRESKPYIEPDGGDRRFAAPEWSAYPVFDYLKQSYLLAARFTNDMVSQSALDAETKKRVSFYTKQFVDAWSPSNFLHTNPEALKAAVDSNGETLSNGLRNFLRDLERGRISMTDESRFEVGRNLAITPGAVVYKNELFELIQYTPTTGTVNERPLLIVPPCINKYYILDLQPDNSFVKYAVDQGNTVFLMSWRNAPPELGKASWDDYVGKGVFEAMDTVQAITGAKQMNALGFCIGGALLSCAVALEKAKKKNRVASLTLLTTMLEYTDVGEIGIYLDEKFVNNKEAELKGGKVMDGRELATTFASLRANDLIWFFVVNNYLKGKTPDAFDLLYWNSDSTNLPGCMYAWYLRNTYWEDNLVKPGKLEICGTKLDLGNVDLPTYILATREDHIVPWHTAYGSLKHLKGDITFVLAASGHIAGVINPVSKNKRNYWIGGPQEGAAHDWLAGAESRPGSWWSNWTEWLRAQGGKQVAPPAALGDQTHPPIEAAPGSYVRVRIV